MNVDALKFNYTILSQEAWIYYRGGAFSLLYATCYSFFVMAFTIYFSYSTSFANEFSIPVMSISVIATVLISFFFAKSLQPKFLKEDQGDILERSKSNQLHFNSYMLPIIPTFFSFVTMVILPEKDGVTMASVFSFFAILTPLLLFLGITLIHLGQRIINHIHHEMELDKDI